MRWTPLFVVALCASSASFAAPRAGLDVGAWQHSEQHHDMHLIEAAEAPAPAEYTDEAGDAVFFLNRRGGTYLPGTNDSRANTSSLVAGRAELPPFGGDTADWDEVVDCVANQFSGYRVRVTDEEPGSSISYFEAVVGGTPSDIGSDQWIGGLSPFRKNCSVIENSVVFVFSDLFGSDNERVCEIIAHELAHSFGVDHQMNCKDPMSYLDGCGRKAFRNERAACGEFGERECHCGGSSQNSMRILAEYLGDLVVPEAQIASPSDGQAVNPSFFVDIATADNIGVELVELYVDGERVAGVETAPFVFRFDGELSTGVHLIETRVYDSENMTSHGIEIEVDPNVPERESPSEARGLEVSPGGCNSGGRAPLHSVWAAALVLVMLRRRRGRGAAVRATLLANVPDLR